jgi:hypothetical protein
MRFLRRLYCKLLLGHPGHKIGAYVGGFYLFEHYCTRCGATWIDGD